MRMLVVMLVHNRFDLVRETLESLRQSTQDARIVLIDNASRHPLREETWVGPISCLRFDENFGNYPVFDHVRNQYVTHYLGPHIDIIAFLHSDVFIWEHGWDQRVLQAFDADSKLGLIGFIGAPGIGANGGRDGTISNFQGKRGGGDWSRHGGHQPGFVPAATIDGCAMIFRTEALEQIGYRPDFPPHHFYDRLISCQMLEAGWRVGVMGIACDHLGGQTAVLEPGWHKLAEEWCKSHGIEEIEGYPGNWELALYREAEKQFLEEYWDRKKLIPCWVDGDWSLETAWKPEVKA